jgi:hypothetical protein
MEIGMAAAVLTAVALMAGAGLDRRPQVRTDYEDVTESIGDANTPPVAEESADEAAPAGTAAEKMWQACR